MPEEGEEITRIGDYKIDRKLATGLVSDLYLARSGNVYMVIKVLNPERAQKLDSAARFEDEIVHPNIIRYRAIKFDPRFQFYFISHYFDNRPFGPRVFRNIRYNETVDLFLKIGSALEHTHSFGTIHGNLKPSNILLVKVNSHYEVMVSDFGIGYIFDPEYFRGETLKRTYVYTAPELMTYWMSERNKPSLPENVSPASDVYSFALVLLEALTGRLPFEEDDYSDVHALLSAKERKRIRLTAVNFPYGIKKIQELSDLVVRSLSYEPEDRPSSMKEVLEILESTKME